MSSIKLCFATHNAHKVAEGRFLLGEEVTLESLQDIGCLDELAEDGHTLEENALQKARYVASKYGVACFADDTGLEVEALSGAPGVYSARYAGEQKSDEKNIQRLLRQLSGQPNRNAVFRTVIALATDGVTHTFEGLLRGRIIEEKRGTHGFGYDPIFVPEGSARALAEMTLEEKNQISHRKKAMEQLSYFLRTFTHKVT